MDSSTYDPPTASASHGMWTERDDDLPAFMAEMLATAIVTEMLETTRTYWQNRSSLVDSRNENPATKGRSSGPGEARLGPLIRWSAWSMCTRRRRERTA
jgi:hypothetical protein